MELELAGANLHMVAVVEGGFFDFLFIDQGPVAAPTVANNPAIFFVLQHRMDPRAHRIGDRDMAVGTSTKQRLSSRIEREVGARLIAREDGEIRVHVDQEQGWNLPPVRYLLS